MTRRPAGERAAGDRAARDGATGDGTAGVRAAAFGDRPDASVAELVTVGATGRPRERWLAAVALGGQGWYAHAATILRGLHAGPDPVIAALARSTMASHLRQLGGHAEARRLDAASVGALAALGRPLPRPAARPAQLGQPDDQARDPDGVDLVGAWSDALLGLAADAVGLGRVGQARRLHLAARSAADAMCPAIAAAAAAADATHPAVAGAAAAAGATARSGAVAGGPSWRVTLRTRWVAAEIELAAGRPAAAVAHAERAVALAEAAGSVRHAAKSALVLGAALTTLGTPDGRCRAEGLLTGALAVSLERGMFPLGWPCGLLLAELVPDRAEDFRTLAVDALTSVFLRADGPMCRISLVSPWFPGALIRSGEPTRTGGGLAT